MRYSAVVRIMSNDYVGSLHDSNSTVDEHMHEEEARPQRDSGSTGPDATKLVHASFSLNHDVSNPTRTIHYPSPSPAIISCLRSC